RRKAWPPLAGLCFAAADSRYASLRPTEVTMRASPPDHRSDHRIDALIERLSTELVDDQGESPEPTHVSEVVRATAARLENAPIQDFVALLVENEALDHFRSEGLHHVLPDEPEAPLPVHGDDDFLRDDVPSIK